MFTFNPVTQKFAFSDGPMPGPLDPQKDRKFVDVKDGKFIIIGPDGKPVEVDLGTLMMMISMKRTENLDNQIALQLDDIQKRNAIIAAMTDAMNKARQAKQDGGKDCGKLIWVKGDPGQFDPKDGTWKFVDDVYKVNARTVDGKTEYFIDPGNMPLEEFKKKARNNELVPPPRVEHQVSDPKDPYKYTVKDPITGKELTLREFAKRYDIPWKNIEKGDDKDSWEANIANIKSRIDILNNDSQMANIKLQNILEKRNNSFEMCTKVMQTNNSSVQSILRNL